MSDYESAIKETLKGIEYIVTNAIANTTKIYDGVIIGYDEKEKWKIQYNGEIHNIKMYGVGSPKVGNMVKVIIPQGNQSLAWFYVLDRTNQIEPYPVGSIYLSINDISPAEIFGGTWEKIKDVFLLASGDKWANGTMGGEETHVLTEAEMPAHDHSIYIGEPGTIATGDRSTVAISNNQNRAHSDRSIRNRGGGLAHNNMPPYLAINVWKRIS